MIGGDKATLHISGKEYKNYMLNLPKDLIRELEKKGEKLQHRERLRVWIERTGLVANARPGSSFGRKKDKQETPVQEVFTEAEVKETRDEVPQEEINKILTLFSKGTPIREIKSIFEEQTDFSWEDVPGKVKKQIGA